jgi:hypothetical protein
VFSESYSAVALLSDRRFCTLKRKEGQGHPTGSKNSVIVRKKIYLKFRIIEEFPLNFLNNNDPKFVHTVYIIIIKPLSMLCIPCL